MPAASEQISVGVAPIDFVGAAIQAAGCRLTCERIRHILIFDHFRTAVRGHHRCFHMSCRLAVSDARLTLPNFYNITVRIANVAARLAVLFLRLSDKLGSSISP